jgi:hypothetical protein
LLEYEENGKVTTVIDDSLLANLTLAFGYQLVNSGGEGISTKSVTIPPRKGNCNYSLLKSFIAKKEKLEKKFDR